MLSEVKPTPLPHLFHTHVGCFLFAGLWRVPFKLNKRVPIFSLAGGSGCQPAPFYFISRPPLPPQLRRAAASFSAPCSAAFSPELDLSQLGEKLHRPWLLPYDLAKAI